MTNNIVTYQPQTRLDLVEVRLDPVKYPRICRIPQETAVKRTEAIVTQALLYRGMPSETGNVSFIASQLVDLVLRDEYGLGMANITIEEIAYVIRRAALGRGPEMYGINITSLYNAIVDYCENEGHTVQQEANNRHHAERQKALKQSAVGVMLDSYAGRMLSKVKEK